MKLMRLRAVVWLLLAICIVIACTFQFTTGTPLQTNLLALLPPTERNPVAEQATTRLTDAAGNRAIFLVGQAAASENPAAAARAFVSHLRLTQAFKQIVLEIPPFQPEHLTSLYQQYRYSLLSDADRASLEKQADLEQRLQRKLYAPFRFGLTLSAAEDPFGFTDAWLASLPLKNLKLEPQDGMLISQHAGKTWVFVSAELPGSAYDSAVQQHVNDAVNAAEHALQRDFPHTEILRTGTVFYAAAARERAEKEVHLIGAGSLAGMLLLLYFVFRSLRPLALGLLSVGFGIGAAVMVTVWTYGEIHLITLVFGASLIGEAIDYAIQYFAAHLGAGKSWEPMAGLRRIAPGLTVALATSLLGYSVLRLAPFPALNQIALFALVGLSAAWFSVFMLLPALLHRPNDRNPQTAVAGPQRLFIWWQANMSRRACVALSMLLLTLAAPGWLQLRSNDDVHLLIARPPALIQQEAQIRNLTGFGNSGQFFLVEGITPDAVLANEEKLASRLQALVATGQITAYQAISSFVPSVAKQAQNYALWQDKVFADEAALKAIFARSQLREDIATRQIANFKASAGNPLTLDMWLKSPLSVPYRFLWLGQTQHGYAAIVLPQGVLDASALTEVGNGLGGVTLVDKAGSVTRLFSDYRQWGGLWLLGAISLIYLLLCLRYSWRQSAVVLAPTLLAMMLALGIFGYLQTPLTLFNLMGMMLVLGVGVNYAIFLREGGVHAAATLAGVLLSAGTTLLSFGLLTFSSMPALSSFGLTLLIGVGIAVLLTPMVLSFPNRPMT